MRFFAGVIVAYIGRSETGEIYRSHLTWGIRTFWWALLCFIIGAVLWLWTAYRTIRG